LNGALDSSGLEQGGVADLVKR